MSRIGKKPIAVPKGVTVKVVAGAVEVQGPKGKLRQAHPAGINFEASPTDHLLRDALARGPRSWRSFTGSRAASSRMPSPA